jgi:hypothetical protein
MTGTEQFNPDPERARREAVFANIEELRAEDAISRLLPADAVLADAARTKLVRATRTILYHFLVARSGMMAPLRYAEVVASLKRLSTLCDKVQLELSSLCAGETVVLDEALAELGSETMTWGTAQLSFEQFDGIVKPVASSLQRPSRGRQPSSDLDHAVRSLRVALETAGLEVTCSESGGRAQRKQVTGSGGEFLKAAFAHCRANVSEAELHGALKRTEDGRRSGHPNCPRTW